MQLKSNLNKFAVTSVLLLAMASTTLAEMFCPIHVGKVGVYQMWWLYGDEANNWDVEIRIGDKMTVDSLDYYHIKYWNYNNDGTIHDKGYFRSTEEAFYCYNPSGEDYLRYQKGRVGTLWSFYDEPHPSGKNFHVIEIVAIEKVTVPYGTFNKAYKYRNYRCETSDCLNPSPPWYAWIVPGIGEVKFIDYWSAPPKIMELVSVSSPLEDNMANTLAFFDESVANGTLVGVGKGKGKKQLDALKKILETAAKLIEDGYNRQACEQLSDAYARCDGDPETTDYVSGESRDDLANKIQEVIDGLGCE